MKESGTDELNIRIGRLLKEARRREGVTQKEMAGYAGISKNHLSEVERGVCRLSVPVLLSYCGLLGITPDALLGITPADPGVDGELLSALRAMGPEGQERVLALLRTVGWAP